MCIAFLVLDPFFPTNQPRGYPCGMLISQSLIEPLAKGDTIMSQILHWTLKLTIRFLTIKTSQQDSTWLYFDAIFYPYVNKGCIFGHIHVEHILRIRKTKYLYIRNKLYEVMKQIYILVEQNNRDTYRANYSYLQNKTDINSLNIYRANKIYTMVQQIYTQGKICNESKPWCAKWIKL
jgi:hypothetical protein